MLKIVIKSEGMMCAMCESHMNDAFSKDFQIKKITSSHSEGQTVIISENDISDDKVKETVEKAGYKFISVSREPYEKKGILSFLSK